jgi:ABC-type transporter Mla subunit MlaD
MKAIAIALIILTGGCSIVVPVDKVLESTAKAEDRIGKSGSMALSGVAALTTSVGESVAVLVTSVSESVSRVGPAIDSLTATIARVGSAVDLLSDRVGAVTNHVNALLDHTAETIDGATTALANVSAIASDARPAVQAITPAVQNVAAVASETRGILADARESVDRGWVSKRLLIGAVILAALSLLHSVIAHWHLGRRLARIESGKK